MRRKESRGTFGVFRVGILYWTFLHLSWKGALPRRRDKKKSVEESSGHLKDSSGCM